MNFVIINMKLTFSLTLSSSQFVCDLMIYMFKALSNLK